VDQYQGVIKRMWVCKERGCCVQRCSTSTINACRVDEELLDSNEMVARTKTTKKVNRAESLARPGDYTLTKGR
jgi:hypothetical protein